MGNSQIIAQRQRELTSVLRQLAASAMPNLVGDHMILKPGHPRVLTTPDPKFIPIPCPIHHHDLSKANDYLLLSFLSEF
jgi:hypothetical protein